MTDNLKIIYNTNNQMHAQMVRMALEKSGIEVFIQNENFSSSMPHYANICGYDIQVFGMDAKRAREVIGRLDNVKDEGEIKCPACNSTNVGLGCLMHRLGLMVAISLIFMQFLPLLRHRYKCGDCGNKWSVKK